MVSNYNVAITFSRLKSKPIKSKHHCEKLYQLNFPFKMIRIAIFKLFLIMLMNCFPVRTLWKLANEIQSKAVLIITLLSSVRLILNQLHVFESFYFSFSCHFELYKF